MWKYIILFGCAFVYYITCKLYGLQDCAPIIETNRNCQIYSQLFALGIHTIILALHCLPLVIKNGDKVFNMWVQGMIAYLLVNNILNEALELYSILFHVKNYYSPLIDNVEKEIIFIVLMFVTGIRVWYYRRNLKLWGSKQY